MEKIRKPFQGVYNIIRFNRHFYIISFCFVALLLFAANYAGTFKMYVFLFCLLVVASTLVTLLASYYIYDQSGLYKFKWVNELRTGKEEKIVNINAGFDETSVLLKEKFPNAELAVLDFYDPLKHTEISIKRARQAYPPYPGTMQTKTTLLPLADNSADKIFVIFAAHEIRNNEERVTFFRQLHKILKPHGELIITEHLRDMPNFLVYNIGFLHFYSKPLWKRTFKQAAFSIKKEIKLTPFISTFILIKNGNSF